MIVNNPSINKELNVIEKNTDVQITAIPKFRFIGSKHNMLHEIQEVIQQENVQGATFFDVFSGSASVGRFFKRKYRIISNDNLYFSYVLQKALIVLNELPSFSNIKIINNNNADKDRLKQVFDYLNKSEVKYNHEGFIYKNYTPASKMNDGLERSYFTEENGKKIDFIRFSIETWFKSGEICEAEYYYTLASLLMAVQKVSNISGTYGAFNKTWDPRAHKALTLIPPEVISSSYEHNSYNNDIYEIVDEVSCDIAYIDPPYNGRQYIANYHLLETIAKYDSPIINGKTGIRAYTQSEKSPFCSKAKVDTALYELLNRLKAEYIIFSYSSEGLLGKDKIIDIFKSTKYCKVNLNEVDYRRFKSNHRTHNKQVKEYLFVGKRK